MGNIRNLVKTRKQELAEEIEEAKKLLTNPLTNPRQLQCLEDNANKLMQKVKSVEKVFDQMFLSRQEEKKQRIIINND
ncbi:hypothetical protein JXE04_01260 [Patescibacteria group bacterium]|nr:hypothetical protein [Patescibacteria group bacterium]